MGVQIKPYDEMSVPELRELVATLHDRKREAEHAYQQADTYLRNRYIREAKEKVAAMSREERTALFEALGGR